MKKSLDPKGDMADSRKWNMALWIADKEFPEIYDDLIQVRKTGCRIFNDSSKDHGLRLEPPKGCDKEERESYRKFLSNKFEGRFNRLNTVLMGVSCMLDGLNYKVALEELGVPETSNYE